MARRQFQVIDVVEVLQHWHAGRPKAVVAVSLGVDVKTVRKYVAAAEAAGIVAGDGQGADRAGWAVRVAGWFPAGGRPGAEPGVAGVGGPAGPDHHDARDEHGGHGGSAAAR